MSEIGSTNGPEKTVELTGLAARYAKAESLLGQNMRKLFHSPRVNASWIKDTETFWYRNTTDKGTEFILVDAEAGTKQPAFDHERTADALKGVLDQAVEPTALPFQGIQFVDDALRVAVGLQRIEVSLETYGATIIGPVVFGETQSPDGRWAVGLRDNNLYIRDTSTNDERQLTTDGAEAFNYGTLTDSSAGLVMRENFGFPATPMVVWSPDSSRFVTHRLDQRDVELMHLLRSSPQDGGRPRLLSYHYGLPGDEHLPTADYFVFEANTGEAIQAKWEPVHTPFVPAIAYGWVWWSDDGTKVYRLSTDRGDRNGALHELDPYTGEVKVLVEEASPTHIMYSPYHHLTNVRTLSTGEILWWSERTGWGHLYLYGTDGSVTTLTSGEWLVRNVVSIDEKNRRVVFTAAGREPGADIYIQQLYFVSLDGGDITALTSDELDHDVAPSKSGKFFVDVMSNVDVPAISVLRNESGDVVMELEEADASALYEMGYAAAERVVVKAADGKTDIYCAIYKPHDFDPSKKYPVVDEIYAGPQTCAAPIRFPLSGGPLTAAPAGPIFASLGFVWVAVDGRGTAFRSKAFMDHNRLVRDGDYIADQVAAIKQLAETRPWMDLDRVGIFGDSCGGLNSMKAMLLEPDFFKVAVSSRGNHDDRMNHAWWGEKFYGLVDEFNFANHANVSLVENLKGKLFLVHGEMDDNAVPHNTMRLVDALIKANKDFDLLIIPNDNHPLLLHSAYFIRRQWDYFVEHLLGEKPPEYRIADIPLDPTRWGGG